MCLKILTMCDYFQVCLKISQIVVVVVDVRTPLYDYRYIYIISVYMLILSNSSGKQDE